MILFQVKIIKINRKVIQKTLKSNFKKGGKNKLRMLIIKLNVKENFYNGTNLLNTAHKNYK